MNIDPNKIYEYIIIGSGPAGLQTGYYLEKFQKDYIILEKNNCCGSFFKKYPIHRKLISINKIHTGSNNKEFNLRHDWNSLLSDNDSLLFKNYSKNFFPKADVMVNYLNDYYKKNNLKVAFNTLVKQIKKLEDGIFNIYLSNNIIKCKKLIIATGLFKSNKFSNIKGIISYSKLNKNKSKFINKNIAIIGQGNSAFETADHLINTAAIIHIFGRGPLKFAWQTHYPGHLRAVNNNFLDTYQLKSQHGIVTFLKDDKIIIKKKGDKYFILVSKTTINNDFDIDNFLKNNEIIIPEGGYDYIIDCTGFHLDTSIFKNCIPEHNGKVPILKSNFESINIKNLFFSGVMAQHISYKKSSSAFIHGFRYLIRSMIKIDTNNLDISKINSKNELFDKIFSRINYSSGLFQMFNCLCDLIIIEKKSIKYIQEIPIKYVKSHFLKIYEKIITLKLNYGKYGGIIKNKRNLGKSSYVFGIDRAEGSKIDKAHLSEFIHPVFTNYHNKKKILEFHLSENLMTEFKTSENHIKPLLNFIEKFIIS